MPNTFIALDVPTTDGSGAATVTELAGSPKTFVFAEVAPPAGRYLVEGSNDGGSTWDVLVGLDGTPVAFTSGSTGPKTVEAVVGRVRVTSIRNGQVSIPPSIAMAAPPAHGVNVFGSLQVPVADGLGAPFDLGAVAGPMKTLTLRGTIPQGARYSVLASMDGVHFDEAALFTADKSGARAVSILCRFLRVERRAGGAAPTITFGMEGTFDPATAGSTSELSIDDAAERETTSLADEEVLFEHAAPLSALASPSLALSFAGVSVQGASGRQVTFRVRLGGVLGTPTGTEVLRVTDSLAGQKSVIGTSTAFQRPGEGATLVKVTGQGDGTVLAAMRGFVLLFHSASTSNQGDEVMSRDVAQRDLDMNGFRISNLGSPSAAGDVTRTDNTSTPRVAAGTGSPGTSFLASPADHVHPAQAGTQALLQLESDDEMEVTGTTEEVVFQRFVDFAPLLSGNLTPTFSGFVSVESGNGTFNVRLGGTPGLADGAIIATITTQSASLEPRIITGEGTARPGSPGVVKVTAATDNASTTCRIADLRVVLSG